MPVPFSHERRQDQPEALLPYIEKRIKQAVVSGELKPGAKLSPSAVAADLGVSHIPVREALTSLAASGYLEHKPRVGFFVRVLSSDDLADIYHWREILEREAFTMAIPRLTSDDIDEMRRLCGQMRKLAAPGQRREYLNLNRQFRRLPQGGKRPVAALPHLSVGCRSSLYLYRSCRYRRGAARSRADDGPVRGA